MTKQRRNYTANPVRVYPCRACNRRGTMPDPKKPYLRIPCDVCNGEGVIRK
jgi:hypothetical protein